MIGAVAWLGRCLFAQGWAPFEAPGHLLEEFEWAPALEVVEKEGKLIARFELPGLKKEEITVTVTEEGLTVTGERKREEEKKNQNWYRTERTYGKFVRTVRLPVGVKIAEVKATFHNGVLELAFRCRRHRWLRRPAELRLRKVKRKRPRRPPDFVERRGPSGPRRFPGKSPQPEGKFPPGIATAAHSRVKFPSNQNHPNIGCSMATGLHNSLARTLVGRVLPFIGNAFEDSDHGPASITDR